MREAEEKDITRLEFADRRELERRLLPKVGMHGVNVMAGVGFRRGLGDLDLGMAEENPKHLSSRVTRCADDTDRDHGERLLRGTTVRQ
jgi:hypothetical protein